MCVQIQSTTSSQRTSTSTSSEDESTNNDDEHGEGESGPPLQSARSHDSGRTVFYPDLHVLTNNEHCTVTPETHKYAAAARSFCFVTTENGEQQDLSNLTTIPCVQRSLCLDEVIKDSSSAQVEFPKGVNSRHAVTLYGHLWKSRRSKGQNAVSRTKKSVSPGNTKVLQAVCWSETLRVEMMD